MSDLFGIFRSFFGLPQVNDRGKQNNNEDFGFQNFNVHTDPLEMHQYFENQINEMFKVFTGLEIGGFPADGAHFDDQSKPSSISDLDTTGNIRDQYLKPGYRDGYLNKTIKSDCDLDGKITLADIDTLIGEKDGKIKINPETGWKHANELTPHFYGSTTIITQLSDGTVEKRQIQRDHLGNEKTTVNVTKPGDPGSGSFAGQLDRTNTAYTTERTTERQEHGNGSILGSIWNLLTLIKNN